MENLNPQIPNTSSSPKSLKPKFIFSPSTYSPMDISPIRKVLPTEIFEHSQTQKPAEIHETPVEKTAESMGETKSSKKRKLEEVEEEWEQLGEPIQRERSAAEKITKSRSSRYIPGLCVNLDWCKSSKFTELLEILEAQGWVKLFSEFYNNVWAYGILNEFCENFSNVKNTCKTRVKGKEIVFSAETLSDVFEVPNEGYDYYFKGATDLKINKVPIGTIVESIGGDASVTMTNHKNFSPLQKLLFIFVWEAIVPRTQHRHEANHMDAVLIYCLENKIQINFPSLMIKHLTHCITNKNKVGYANLIMTIVESCGVSLLSYPSLKMQTNHFIQPITLASHNLCVKDGKTQFLQTESKSNKVEVEVSGVKEVEETESEEEEEGEKKKVVVTKTSAKGKGKQGGARTMSKNTPAAKRKSIRLASRPAEKLDAKSTTPAFLDLDAEEDDKEEEQESKAVPPPTNRGFDAFSSSNIISGELRVIKASLGMVVERLVKLESTVASLAQTSKMLVKELKDSAATLTQGQKDLMTKLDEMVVEEIPEVEVDDNAA